MAYAFRGRPTLKDVKRQLRNGSFRELNETRIYSNVTEMDATIESDTSQNTNSLISSGYLITGLPMGKPSRGLRLVCLFSFFSFF